MVGRLLRVTATVLVIAIAFVTPVLTTSTPASADTVINGCTIVANPTPTNFTNCPGVDLGGAALSGVNLSYANLAGAQFVSCFVVSFGCTGANLDGTNLSFANLTGASFATCIFDFGVYCAATGAGNLTNANLEEARFASCSLPPPPFLPSCASASLVGATLTDANLTEAALADCVVTTVPPGITTCATANLSAANLSDADLTGATIEACPVVTPSPSCVSVNLAGADLTGTIFVPSNETVPATSTAGAVASYTIPPPLTAANPTSCSPSSGSTFPIGTTTVTCTVFDNQGDQATGTFTVTVQGAADQLTSLQQDVTGVGPGKLLSTAVSVAQFLLAVNQIPATCFVLDVFVFEVDVLEYFESVSPATGGQLVASANRIENVLSC